ncbi:hypothetical protein JCM15415_18170 [Methanobacterium movens]
MAQKKMTEYGNMDDSKIEEKRVDSDEYTPIGNMDDLKVKEIRVDSDEYPHLLKNIKKPPEVLYALGNVALLDKPSIAIVGTRKPGNNGKSAAEKIARHYAEKNFVIVSGLALGIDAIAMNSALSAGAPVIGVLPSSLDNIVPKKNRKLAEEVLNKGGLLISESPEGSKVHNYHYINRNRIISGISIITAIAETSIKGGTMHTFNFAKEQVRGIIIADIPTDGNEKLKKEGYPVFKI